MRTFTRKAYGRIYCEDASQVAAIEAEIKEMDEFEYGYLPSKFVAPFSEYPSLVYTHKFDSLDIDLLTARLWKKGIKIFCMDSYEEFMQDKDVA